MKQLESRKEKINFLKALEAGNASIDDIRPRTWETWIEIINRNDPNYKKYVCGNMYLTYDDLLIREKSLKSRVNFIIMNLESKVPENSFGYLSLKIGNNNEF